MLAGPMKSKWLLPMGIIAVLILFRIACIFRLEVNSDEAQHLHVIYGWLEGALPYRDRFDNHTPLFHFLYLPLAAFFGETPNIILIARLAILPIGLLALGMLFELGHRLFDPETALWSLAIVLALPDWSLKSIEFRPDVLWVCLWFGALLLLTRAYQKKRLSPWTFFWVGVLLGAALMTSIKTLLLLPALGIGWLGVWLISQNFREKHSVPFIAGAAGAGVVGLAIIPAIFIAWFHAQGALDAMRFCLLDVNRETPHSQRMWIFFAGMIPALGMTFQISKGNLQNGLRAAIFLTTVAFLLLLLGFSPSLKKQTFLPIYPLLILFAWHGWTIFCQRLHWSHFFQKASGCAVCFILGIYMLWESQIWRNGLDAHQHFLNDVMNLSKPGETILDLKGESIFRPRPVYLAFVLATRKAIADRRIPEEDVYKVARKGTMLASGSGAGFPSDFRRFIKTNYIAVEGSAFRVAGQKLKPSQQNGQWIARVMICLPGEYVLIRNGRYDSSISEPISFANAGEHIVELGNDQPAMLLWKRAAERGYQPAKSP